MTILRPLYIRPEFGRNYFPKPLRRPCFYGFNAVLCDTHQGSYVFDRDPVQRHAHNLPPMVGQGVHRRQKYVVAMVSDTLEGIKTVRSPLLFRLKKATVK